MKRVICAVSLTTTLLVMAVPALAQTPTASAPTPAPSANGPTINLGYVGGFLGISAVKNVNTIAGGEAGIRVYHNLDVIAEGGWAKDGVTRRRTDLTASLATLLQASTGQPASSSVVAPVYFGMGGLRYVFDVNVVGLHPYVLGEVGRASIEYKPRFTLNGTDITDSLPTYGVTLGSDIANKEVRTAYGAGAGVLYTRGMFYLDATVRLLSIQTESQATNLTRAHIGLGVRF